MKHQSNMNYLLSRGMCLTPPFNRSSAVCNANDETTKDGFFNEMFRFEYFDWTNVVAHEKLKAAHQDRLQRFQHCNFSISEDVMKALVNPFGRRVLRMIDPADSTGASINNYPGGEMLLQWASLPFSIPSGELHAGFLFLLCLLMVLSMMVRKSFK